MALIERIRRALVGGHGYGPPDAMEVGRHDNGACMFMGRVCHCASCLVRHRYICLAQQNR